MRILLIGDTCLQNDAVKKLLISQGEWEIRQITPSGLINQDSSPVHNQFKLSLLDLSSVTDNFEEVIKTVRQIDMAANLVILHDNQPDDLTQKMLAAGADHCLSTNAETEEFIKTISTYTER